jgi:hypothetical protein
VDASAGHRSAQGVRVSSRRAISSATASWPNGATICTPIGHCWSTLARPDALEPVQNAFNHVDRDDALAAARAATAR